MLIGRKIAFTMVIFCLMIVLFGYISLIQFSMIAEPLYKDIPENITKLAKTSNLDSKAQLIRYYDEVLTQSARNYAFSQEKKWEERYNTIVPKLDKQIKDVIDLGDIQDKTIFSNINNANLALVEMELQSMELVNEDNVEEAIKILDSDEYWKQKRIYAEGLEGYGLLKNEQYNEAVSSSTDVLLSTTANTQKLFIDRINTVILSILIFIIIASFLGYFMFRSITNRIANLKTATNKIAMGDFNFNIKLDGNDEIGELGVRFENMRQSILDTQQKLVTSESKYRNLYEKSSDMYRTINKKGIIIDCNASYVKSLGYLKSEIIGKSVFDHVDEKNISTMNMIFEEWKETGIVNNQELWLKRKDGSTFPVLLSANNLYDDDNNLIGSGTTLKDISDIYKARKKIEENEQNMRTLLANTLRITTAKDEFVSMITHELKTPLVPIISYTELLLSEKLGQLSSEQKKRLDIVKTSSYMLQKMISELLDVQQIEFGHLKLDKNDHNIVEVIKNIIVKMKPAAIKKGIHLTADYSKKINCFCDKDRIEQVLGNIISNAIDFCPKENGKIQVKAQVSDNSVKIIVSDNGIGIVKDKVDKIFQKFYQIDSTSTREHSGSGLGLAICKGIIDTHGGKIWAESEGTNKGSEVHIVLPLTEHVN